MTSESMFDLRTHNGIVTASNPGTGQHRTFQVRTQADDAKFAPGKRVVALLTGPNNERDYRSFGFVSDEGRVIVFRKLRGQTRQTIYDRYAELLESPETFVEKFDFQFNFEGRCRRCNRKLTTPESVESGIGPVCAGRE